MIVKQTPKEKKMIIKQILKDMVKIPAGEFMMGSEENGSEYPVHWVRLKSFSIGKYLVTQDQYEAVMGAKPSRNKGRRYPVEMVSWYDAQEFCQKLTELAGKSKTKFKLPSEAQWEYACRAGSEGKWCFGDDEAKLEDYAWYSKDLYGQTYPVGEKKPNAFGLYDMHGNVWEWCEDHWHMDYDYAPTDGNPWIDEYDTYYQPRVVRGGCWYCFAGDCRSACRSGYLRDDFDVNIGFRICSGRRK